jgi:hypothetical protein
MKLKTKKGGFLFKKKNKTNICDENSKKQNENISLNILGKHNLIVIRNEFFQNINKERDKKKLEDFKNYKNIAKELYNIMDLYNINKEFYKLYVKKKEYKISKPTFISLMNKYFEILILYTITERVKDLLFYFHNNKSYILRLNKDKLLLTNNDQEQYGKLEISLYDNIDEFINLEILNCDIVKTFLEKFTSHLEKFLGMYNRIKTYNKVSTPNPNLEYESELFTENEYNRLYEKISNKLDLENLQDKLQQKIITHLNAIRSRNFKESNFYKKILLNVNENISTKRNLNYLFNNFTDEEKKDLLQLNGQAFVKKFVELKVSHMPKQSYNTRQNSIISQQSSGRNSGLSSRRNSGLSSGPSSRPNSVLSSGLSSQPNSSIRFRSKKGYKPNRTKRQGGIYKRIYLRESEV